MSPLPSPCPLHPASLFVCHRDNCVPLRQRLPKAARSWRTRACTCCVSWNRARGSLQRPPAPSHPPSSPTHVCTRTPHHPCENHLRPPDPPPAVAVRRRLAVDRRQWTRRWRGRGCGGRPWGDHGGWAPAARRCRPHASIRRRQRRQHRRRDWWCVRACGGGTVLCACVPGRACVPVAVQLCCVCEPGCFFVRACACLPAAAGLCVALRACLQRVCAVCVRVCASTAAVGWCLRVCAFARVRVFFD